MKTPTAWDLQIISELDADIVRLLRVIGDSAADDMVRDTLGDSRPETVVSMRRRIERKREELRAIMRQFPEYFCL